MEICKHENKVTEYQKYSVRTYCWDCKQVLMVGSNEERKAKDLDDYQIKYYKPPIKNN